MVGRELRGDEGARSSPSSLKVGGCMILGFEELRSPRSALPETFRVPNGLDPCKDERGWLYTCEKGEPAVAEAVGLSGVSR